MRYMAIAIIVSIAVSMAAAPAFSQAADKEKAAAVEAPAPVAEAPAAPAVSAPAPAAPGAQAKETAIYGEVQAVNAQALTLSVRYYDYDSDSEKTAEIAADGQTKMENAKAIGDIRKGDWVDVTYVTSGGKNVAKSVLVEKEEVEPAPAAPAASGTTAQ